eukprot:s493_g9.t1
MKQMAKPLLSSSPTPSASKLPMLSFEIQGMHCKSCIRKVEAALQDLPISATVELRPPAAGWLEVAVDSERPERMEEVSAMVQKAVEGLDLQIRPAMGTPDIQEPVDPKARHGQAFEFEVLGMKCGSCVLKAEKALQAVPWPSVTEVSVNLLSESARVLVEDNLSPSKTDAAARVFKEALQSVGLEATLTKTPSGSAEIEISTTSQTSRLSFDFEVLGMKCGSCVQKAEAAVKALADVEDVNVNLLSESATVDMVLFPAPEAIAAASAAVISALASVGLTASVSKLPELAAGPTTLHFEVLGMTCASCVGTVERALKSVPGVADAQVNLLAESATVRLTEAVPEKDLDSMAEALQAAVEAAGYQASFKPAAVARGQEHEAVLVGRAPAEQDLEQGPGGSSTAVVAELQQLTGVASVVPSESPEALELQVRFHGERERVLRELLWTLEDAGGLSCLDRGGLITDLRAVSEELLAKGGLGTDWRKAVTRGLSAEDVGWNDGEAQGDAVLDLARTTLSKDALVEYECYNDQKRPQGRALIVLRDWEDYSAGILAADHLKASDPYYEWYGSTKLKNGGGVYHLCGSKLKDCAVRLSRSDRRELVHIQRWRLVNPLIMAENDYMKDVAIELVKDWVKGFVPAQNVPEPGVGRAPGAPGGSGGDHTGLDRAAEEARIEKELKEASAEAHKKQKKEPEKIEPRGSVGALLERRAAEQREAWRRKEMERRRKTKERGRSRSRRRRRRGSKEKSDASSRSKSEASKSSQSSEGFQVPSTRGEDELWRLSKRHPGRLLKAAMKELQRYLGERAGTGEEEEDWSRKTPRTGGLDGPEIKSPGNFTGRPVMADSSSSRADTPVGSQPHRGAGTPKGSSTGAGSEQVEEYDGKEPGAELEVGRRRRGQTLGSRDAVPKSGAATAEEPGANQAGEIQRGVKRDSERDRQRRAEASHRVEAGHRSPESRERRKRKGQETALLEEGQKRERQRRRKEVTGEKPHSPEASYEQESFETAGLTPDASHLLEMMKAWLRTEECGGLSIAQNGALLALVIARSGTPLSKYMERLAGPGSDDGGDGRRQRSLLPMPLLPDSKTELRKVWDTGEFRRLAGAWGAKKSGKEKAAREMRRIGLLIWHGLVVTFLNFLWRGGVAKSRVPSGEPTKAQRMAQERLWETVKDFVDDTSEVVEKAQKLTLDQILPGLPPSGFGGSVPLIELCDGELRERLEDALGNLLPEEELPDDLPTPKVHASPEQWELIVQELHKRGLVVPVEDPVRVRGKMILNRAFGVPKPGKFLEDERAVLRLIMDFRCTNTATRILTGDVGTLSGAAALQHVVLPEGQVLRVSADDLVAAFYLFGLPKEWSRLMLALRSPLRGGAGLIPALEVRRDAIFPDLGLAESLWSLYLDDTSLLELMEKKVAESLQDKPSEEQLRLRKAYEHWGIPVSEGKALVRATTGEKLGAVLDGDKGLLKGATRRALETLSLGFWLMRQELVPRKALQVFLGREVHTMQFRRPLFGTFDYLWKEVSEGEVMRDLSVKSVEEILLAGMCQPMRVTNLRAKVSDLVTASDASESGGGIVYGGKLTSQGIKEVYLVEEEEDDIAMQPGSLDEKQVTLVFDCFAGIGGLSRALQLARIKVDRLVVIAQDPGCRRLNTVRWPGCDVWSDITKVTKKDVERMMRSVPGLTLVIAGGGSPCQGLSKLSSRRLHLADPRSQLFFKYSEVLGWIDEVAAEMKVTCVQMLENVLGDDEDVEEMSSELGTKPILCCSSGLSRVRRPRLYWSNVELEEHCSYSRAHYPLYDEVIFEEATEPLEKVADRGWHWPHGEVDEQLRLPTFTRAIPRRKPPPDPAGIRSCDEETLELWRKDEMKYPPYTYKEEYRFAQEGSMVGSRVASVSERERLMGFPTGYTLALHKHEEEICQVVAREAALGNSFHAVTVACLMDLWLWTAQVRTDPLGASAIVEGWHAEMDKERYENYGLLDVEGFKQLNSHEENDEEERLLSQEKGQRRAEWMRLCTHSKKGGSDPQFLGARLVHQFLRRTEFRGSDVRLDLGITYRPDSIQRSSVDPRRQKLGRLSEQKVSQNTKERYQVALQGVATYAGTTPELLVRLHNLDELLCGYLEKLWEDGDSKTMASYALASVQFHRPAVKGQLKQAWQLMSLWNRLAQPRRATPLDPQLLLAFAGTFLKWKWKELAHLCVVGFCGLLRTGEMFLLKREHVVLPRQKGQSAVLISEEMGIRSLQFLCKGKSTGEPLTEATPAQFRRLWKEVVLHLKLEKFNYMPYSLRRGAATSAYREGMSFDKLLVKGRWQHIATCRLYLDQALQEYTALCLPMSFFPFLDMADMSSVAFVGPATTGTPQTLRNEIGGCASAARGRSSRHGWPAWEANAAAAAASFAGLAVGARGRRSQRSALRSLPTVDRVGNPGWPAQRISVTFF